MKRREFITLLGAAATPSMLWPLAARPQQPAMPLIGLLFRGSCEQMEELMAAFRKGLSETGYVEGRNVTFELRQARNEQGRLPELAADLVRRQVFDVDHQLELGTHRLSLGNRMCPRNPDP